MGAEVSVGGPRRRTNVSPSGTVLPVPARYLRHDRTFSSKAALHRHTAGLIVSWAMTGPPTTRGPLDNGAPNRRPVLTQSFCAVCWRRPDRDDRYAERALIASMRPARGRQSGQAGGQSPVHAGWSRVDIAGGCVSGNLEPAQPGPSAQGGSPGGNSRAKRCSDIFIPRCSSRRITGQARCAAAAIGSCSCSVQLNWLPAPAGVTSNSASPGNQRPDVMQHASAWRFPSG